MKQQCPNLYKIKLEDNDIKSFNCFQALSELKKLKKINLKGNPIVESNKDYRKKIFDILPNLFSIDNIDRYGNNVDSSLYDEEGEDGLFNEGSEISDDVLEEEDDDNEDFEDEEVKHGKKTKK